MMPGAPAQIVDERWAELKDLIIARSGHHYYVDKDLILAERVTRRMAARKCRTIGDYSDLLALPDAPEWAELFAEITIGETFFFRFAEQFAALRTTILPALIARRAATRRLRIWSAGCATGAETYSLAILVQTLLGADFADWHVAILGTDLNEAALVKARTGAFGPWALRTLGPDERRLYFDATPDGRTYVLKRLFQASVRFRAHNLLDILDPGAALDLNDFDLILCRNVLIYFQGEVVTRIIDGLGDRLTTDGWLILGHAEAGFAEAPRLQRVETAGMTAYQPRQAPAAPEAVATAPAPLPFIEKRRPPTPRPAPRAVAPIPLRAPAPPPPTPRPSDIETTLETLRGLADAGAYPAALDLCTRITGDHPLDPRGHYYEGLIHRSCGRAREAREAFDRALYLDSSFLMAHYQKGLALLDAGEHAQGRRSLVLAAQLADRCEPETAVVEGEGLSAATLSSYARVVLARSPD